MLASAKIFSPKKPRYFQEPKGITNISMKNFQTKLSLLALVILGVSTVAVLASASGDRAKLYAQASFEKQLNSYCNFKPALVAQAALPVKSKEQAQKILAMLSDFEGKANWSKKLDPKNSFLLLPAKAGRGRIYHLTFRPQKTPVAALNGKPIEIDYLIERAEVANFKGCVLHSSLPIKYSTIEYKILSGKEGYSIQRIAKGVPNNDFLSPIFQGYWAESNLNSLREVVSQVK